MPPHFPQNKRQKPYKACKALHALLPVTPVTSFSVTLLPSDLTLNGAFLLNLLHLLFPLLGTCFLDIHMAPFFHYFFFFINLDVFLFFKFSLYYIFPLSFSPFISLLPPAINHCCSCPWALFPFHSIPPPPNHPLPAAVICSLWVSVLIVSSVCSLDSTYEWNHMVFVFLWLAYFT